MTLVPAEIPVTIVEKARVKGEISRPVDEQAEPMTRTEIKCRRQTSGQVSG